MHLSNPILNGDSQILYNFDTTVLVAGIVSCCIRMQAQKNFDKKNATLSFSLVKLVRFLVIII